MYGASFIMFCEIQVRTLAVISLIQRKLLCQASANAHMIAQIPIMTQPTGHIATKNACTAGITEVNIVVRKNASTVLTVPIPATSHGIMRPSVVSASVNPAIAAVVSMIVTVSFGCFVVQSVIFAMIGMTCAIISANTGLRPSPIDL